jgi:hypothetical protein
VSGQSETSPAEDAPRDWFFTFGHGQAGFPGFVRIHGTFGSAREEMFRRYGTAWCMQYESAEAAGVERWGLIERDAMPKVAP